MVFVRDDPAGALLPQADGQAQAVVRVLFEILLSSAPQ